MEYGKRTSMEPPPLRGVKILTILAAILIAILIGSRFGIPPLPLLLLAVGCYTLLEIIWQISGGVSLNRRWI
jgi:hypothetical protein